MTAVRVENIGAHDGERVTLRGWLAARRSSGKIHFLQLRDGSGTIQCVMGKNDVPAEVFARADHLPDDSNVLVRRACPCVRLGRVDRICAASS